MKSKHKPDIMSFFPRGRKPREVQIQALKALEKHWDDADVFVVSLSVGAGKSNIAKTLANWRGTKGCAVITPTKMLVDQYEKDFKDIHILRGKSDYWCSTYNRPVSKVPVVKGKQRLCKWGEGCTGCVNFVNDVRKAKSSRTHQILGNYFVYMAYDLYRETVVIDEAQKAINVLKELGTKKWWDPVVRFPSWVRERSQLRSWLEDLQEGGNSYFLEKHGLDLLLKELQGTNPTYAISIEEDWYAGKGSSGVKKLERVIKMVPLDLKGKHPHLWPASVQKIVLMSGTICIKDVEQLGLAGKRVKIIEADSPIPAERRPVLFPPEAVNMSYKNLPNNLGSMMDLIREIMDSNPESKGIIHTTYALNKKLKEEFADSDRLLFHNKGNKTKMYHQFRNSDEPKVLVASGMYEGIDLAGPEYKWQIVAKVPWPSLADPAIKFLSEKDPEWYTWECFKDLLQACGRICRGPDDYGETIILDSTFKQLWYGNIERRNKLVPKWFQDSVEFL